MAKYYGKIGYAENLETTPGVWTDVITERSYVGDVLKNTKRWQANEHLNDDLVINNQISIVADAYAYNHFHNMKYVRWMGSIWKVTMVEVQRPRLLISIGGVYNGETS